MDGFILSRRKGQSERKKVPDGGRGLWFRGRGELWGKKKAEGGIFPERLSLEKT